MDVKKNISVDIINSSETLSNGDLWNGVVLEKSEILELSEGLSRVYIEIIDKLSLIYSSKYNLPQDVLRIILRTAIVPITHCFFERLIRLNKIVNVSKGKPLVAAQSLVAIPNTIEAFHERLNTQGFNQSVISLLTGVWGLESIHVDQADELNLTQPASFRNNLFKISKNKLSIANILSRCNRFIKWVPAFGRFPVLTFANATGALHQRFFYLKNFKEVDDHWKLEPVKGDLGLRKLIFNESQLASNEVSVLLSNSGFSDKQQLVITNLYFEFLRDSFPLQFLEGFQNNYDAAKKALAPFKVNALLSSGEGGTCSSFVTGHAKSRGFKIITAQHGGQYGYIKDTSPFFEIEWARCDEFLTWGWTVLPRHPAIRQIQTHPLPSPWLSERRLYWKGLVIGGDKPFDILWMPQMMKRFTGAAQGASSIRRDVINEFSTAMIDFVKNATKAKIKIFCKPYNPVTVYLMADTYKAMGEIGGDFFTCSDRFDKGLTYEYLEKCQLVLWDQPGTGFLECLACNIPTMILWPRLYSEEEAWCVDDFIQLEKVGLIHRTSQSLIDEIQRFLIDPVGWMNDSQRKMTVQSFSNKYALTDDKWWQVWRVYLKQLKK